MLPLGTTMYIENRQYKVFDLTAKLMDNYISYDRYEDAVDHNIRIGRLEGS